MLDLEYPRLPLMRELSVKLTEGETLHSQINIFAYTTKIAGNIQIANSHYVRFIDSKSFVRISSFLASSTV